ncbi:MAG: ATP-binding protein [Phycisphaerae bacterium]|nr:ATP-binding protein [Phycisphaerae bacterium]
MYIPRILESKLSRLAGQYPVVTITGPRQSGKTTLCKKVFPNMPYVSLEAPDHRALAQEDPRGFFARWPGAIIDEIQRVPSLLSYIQGIVDETPREGQFILTGSAQLELMESVTQSLAGRTALLKLYPFSLEELLECPGSSERRLKLDELLYTGMFPRIHDKKLNPTEAHAFYTETYIERDVRSILQLKDRSLFATFLRLCAGRSAQVLNLTNLANDVGVSVNTIKSWLSVLETGFMISFLQPHHANYRKRLTKSPKLYFVDSGLMCYLLGITDAAQLATHPLRGAIFETFVVTELRKQAWNQGNRPRLFYYRTSDGHEVDVLIDKGETVKPVEIKSAITFRDSLTDELAFYGKLNPGAEKGVLIYGGDDDWPKSDANVLSYRSIHKLREDFV